MTKYFSIVLNGANVEQEKKIAAMWSGYGWWHGIPNFWLLRDHTGVMTATSIRDALQAIAPLSQIMVMEAQPTTWASRAMNESNREWLKKYWPPEGA